MESVFVFDSGSGGEFVTRELLRELPNENFVLFKDTQHCPYGTKSKRKLWHIVHKILAVATKVVRPKAIVVACNTASSLFEDKIRKKCADIPVFFVTPLINEKILSQKTLILATTRTAKCNKQIENAKRNSNCIVLGFDDLAKKIDLARLSSQAKADLKLYLLNKLSKYKTYGIKNVVLACTHYTYIKKQLREILGEVKFFEKSKIVAKELKLCLQGEFAQSENQNGLEPTKQNMRENKQRGKQNKSISQLFKTQVVVVENLQELKNIYENKKSLPQKT